MCAPSWSVGQLRVPDPQVPRRDPWSSPGPHPLAATNKRLLFARNAAWHIEIEKGKFQGVRKSSHEEAEARAGRLQVHEAWQLVKEEEALEKAKRNRQLRLW